MPLPRHLRTFSLRTLMVLTGVCSLAAWWWTDYRYGAERRLQAALSAMQQENPRAKVILYRRQNYCEVLARDIELVSAKLARRISRAELIHLIRLRAASDDGLLMTIQMKQDAAEALQLGFGSVLNGSIEIKCARTAEPEGIHREDLHAWSHPLWKDWDDSSHLLEIRRPPAP